MNNQDKANRRLTWRMVFIVLLMFGFGFALVPFYDVFCDLTGLNGKVKNQATTESFVIDEKREIHLGFDTSVNESMPLAFKAEQSRMNIHPGQFYTVVFRAENLSDRRLVGQAIPSIAPGTASPYLKKIECFCFTEQVFEPHEVKQMPVKFAVDPSISADVIDMTLSYTFFDITKKTQN